MKLSLLLTLLFSAPAMATLYGADSRQYTRNRSIAIMISNTTIQPAGISGTKNLVTATLNENQYMCKSERFANVQGFYVSCTGFLIAPDLILTAGHCAVNFGEVRDEANPYCTDFSWYFGFEADAAGSVMTKNIPANEIYECEKVVHAAHTSNPVSPREIIFADDFAIIKLKRTVTNRTPLKLTSVRPSASEPISMIGHPLGGPKLNTKGKVLTNEPAYVRAAVSGFDGSSGSPVFNTKGEAFGILVRGYPPSLIDHPTNACSMINRCTADAKNCTQDDPNGQPAGDHIMPIGLIPELKTLGLTK